ncbi:hypothetical protein FOL47_005291 [Perkinsus chesapeaki]|uniref:C3H1-type domain-containing protein n=1 Tax=Perkinsus chesapeaki TaxID=330153 RepID=A0A7J6LY82_PERCH|nr:hypothetical protein FOL47_005291 [Perkinsus chesapeaki]
MLNDFCNVWDSLSQRMSVPLDDISRYPYTGPTSNFLDGKATSTITSPSSTTPLCSKQTESSQPSSSPSVKESKKCSRGKKRRQRQRDACSCSDFKGAYKTELCRCVVEGTMCRFGAQRCKWAHSLEELIEHRNMAKDHEDSALYKEVTNAIVPIPRDSLHRQLRRRSYSLPEPAHIRCLLPSSIWVELLTCDDSHLLYPFCE